MRGLFVIMAALVIACTANATERLEAKEEKGSGGKSPYVHVVIFTVKKDAPAGTADKLLADCHELLAKIPTVRELRAGKPAEKSTEISKQDYHVGLMILFDDHQGLDTYLKHELHVKFVEKYLKHIDEKVLSVYDFVNAKK